MGTFFVYILKSSVCLAVFYLFYRLLLSRETFHRFNRVALLGILALACLVPLAEVTVQEPTGFSGVFFPMEEMFVEGEADVMPMEETSAFPWREAMVLLYAAGVLFFVARHLWSMARMFALMRRCKRKPGEGIVLLTHGMKVAPFSWMRCIVISEQDLAESGEAILAHERAHIRLCHSWDLLLADVCIFFQWFNPAAWLLKQELQNIHEFEADEAVINRGVNAKEYQMLLIKKAVGTRLYSMANSLNHSSLKKRITMMIKKKSNPWARAKYLYVLPLAAVTMAAFARPEVSDALAGISSVKVNDLTSIVKTNDVKSVENLAEGKVKVTGKVYESDGKIPVVGASVIIKGTNVGTISDFDGQFTLPNVDADAVLQISYIGYQTQTVPVPKDGKPLKVLMTDDAQHLSEMVVVGYAPAEETKAKETKAEEAKPQSQPTEQAIFTVVEEMPEFPGGMAECLKFLARNIKYPVAAQEAKIEGRVVVQFVVGKDGSISDIKVARGVNPDLDAEAIRVIAKMPNWTPGKQRGKAVAVKYSLPIIFRLQQPESAAKSDEMLQLSLKVDKEAGTDAVALAKEGLREGYKQQTEGSSSSPIVGTVRTSSDEKFPLIVIDGVEKPGMRIREVDVTTIEAMYVMSEKNAVEKYGKKASDGAIVITTKKK